MYKREKKSWLKHLDFTFFDIIFTQAAYIIAYRLRYGEGLPYDNEWYERLAVVLVLIQICTIFFTEPYKDILRRNKIEEFKKTIMNCSLTYFIVVLYVYSTKLSEYYSRLVLYGFWIGSIPLCYVARVFWKNYIRRRVVEDRNRAFMVLLTSNNGVVECIKEFERNRYRNFVIKGIVIMDADRQGDVIRDVPVVANCDNFLEYIRTHVVDEVFINSNDLAISEKISDELLEMGVTVHFKIMHNSLLSPSKVVEPCGNFLVLTSSMNIATFRQAFLKRLMDIAGGLVGMIFVVIAYIIFAPIIKIQSPDGPVFFKQVRVGKNGRKFRLYKFRSMYPDAEARKAELMEQNKMSGNMFKVENDPRIIPIGRFMRKYSIDELPQFWNVLKGDMSLVGTRPPTEDEFEEYAAHHRARLSIRPGLTGMWQVSGRSNITDFEEIVELDTSYISNWNLGMDVRILFKTLLVVVKGSGAA